MAAGDIDLLVRALSMGKLHHAMMGTAAVAIGTAAIPGTLVNLAAGGGERSAVRFGHPSGTLRVGAEASQANGEWTVTKAIMSRSANPHGRLGARTRRGLLNRPILTPAFRHRERPGRLAATTRKTIPEPA